MGGGPDETGTPQERLEAYKKKIGRQYMEGEISEDEYDELLAAKENELGLGTDIGVADPNARECPACGALVGKFDTECSICGMVLEPVSLSPPGEEPPVEGTEPIPEEEFGLEGPGGDGEMESSTCPECGAVVSRYDTVCSICGAVLGGKTETPDAKPPEQIPEDEQTVEEEPPVSDEIVCPSCGAFLEKGVTECFICGTVIGEVPAPETAEEAPEEVPEPPSWTPDTGEGEVTCPGCGAVLEQGTTECFICGTAIGGVPVPEAAGEALEEPLIAPSEAVTEAAEEPLETIGEPEEAEAGPEVEEVEEIVLNEGEILCPSCGSVIPEDSEKCPECWTDLSLYIQCPSCHMLTPSGEEVCRECFAPLPKTEEKALETEMSSELEETLLDLEIPEEIELTEDLREEMTELEAEEEQGKECLVCGAIFGSEDEVCPVCHMEYGVEIEEVYEPEQEIWVPMEVEVKPTVYVCPNCGANVTGLDATEREINEGKWFYRGILTIFTGIFFTSFSIWARGISVENTSLGMHPPPTDVLLNILGWIFVSIGFAFWVMSWKLHEEKVECPQCGIEIGPDTEVCVNCGTSLDTGGEDIREPDSAEGEYPEEPLEPGYAETEPDEGYPVEALETGYAGTEPDEEYPVEALEPGYAETEPDEEYPVESPEPGYANTEPDEEYPVETSEPGYAAEGAETPRIVEPASGPAEPSEELPVTHEEHKKCPGCGIYVDINAEVCPVCDTVLSEEVPDESFTPDGDIEVPSEEDEIAGLGVPEEPQVPEETMPEGEPAQVQAEEGSIVPEGAVPAEEPAGDLADTVPDGSEETMECPSCGAEITKGMKECPICEYPLE